MAAMATVDDLQAILGFDMTDEDKRVATGALAYLSGMARHYGNARWGIQGEVPEYVTTIVLNAARRFMTNPEGFTLSRAGDETVQFADLDKDGGNPYFTSEEIAALRAYAGMDAGLYTAGSYAYGQVWKADNRVSNTKDGEPGYVPSEYGGFPMWFSDGSPWP